MLKGEWKKLLSNRLMLVVVLAVIAIPTIYTTLFLGSMWDPYGSVENLPVALVNQDQPVEYEGKTLNVGDQLVDNLQEDASLDFRLTDADDAAENPNHLKKEIKTVTKGDIIPLPLASDGGAVVHLTKVN